MKKNSDNNRKKKMTIQIIIGIIIILLLVSSCTAYSFFGKIGMFTIERSIKIDENTNDKEIIKNKNLTFDVESSDLTYGSLKVNLKDGTYKISFSSLGITTKNFTCQTSDSDVSTCVVEDGYVRLKLNKTGKFTLQVIAEENNKQYIAEITIDVISKDESKKKTSTNTKAKETEKVKEKNEAVETTHPEKQDSAYLKSLSINGFELSPKFNSKVYDYVVEVEHDTTSVKINATAKNGTIKTKLGKINLTGDSTIYQIVVENSAGEKTIYTIKINKKEKYHIKQEAEKEFKVDADYTLFNPGGKVYVDDNLVDPSNYTSQAGSVIIIFTQAYYDTLTQDYHSMKVELNTGDIVQTIFEKTTPYIPPIIKSKDANLKSLAVTNYDLSPDFDKDTLNYSITVPNSVEEVDVSAIARHPKALVTVSGYNNLNVGDNTVTIRVTAEDGTTIKNYTITVTRLAAPSPTDYYITSDTSYTLNYRAGEDNYKNIILNSNVLNDGVTASVSGNKYTLTDGTNTITLESNDFTFEYISDSTPNQYTIKSTYSSSGNKSITVTAIREGITINTYTINFTIKDKYIVIIDANGGFFTPVSNLEELTMYANDVLDLSTYNTAYKESDIACVYYNLDHYNTASDDGGTSHALDENITITGDLTLYAIYSTTDTTHDIEEEKTLYLTDVELFLNQDGIKEKIKPGSEGAYVMTFENTTGKKIKLESMTLNEENICVESGNYCLNMGYVVKDALTTTYYYGASNNYSILNKDNLTSAKVYDSTKDVYSMSRVISLEDKELEAGESAQLSLLWKWVDDDANDYKIGDYVNENPTKDIYYITISFKFKIIDKGC